MTESRYIVMDGVLCCINSGELGESIGCKYVVDTTTTRLLFFDGGGLRLGLI